MKLKIGAKVSNESDLKADLSLLKSCGYDYAEFGLNAPKEFAGEYAKNLKEYKSILPVLAAHMKAIRLGKDEVLELENFILAHSKIGCKNFIFHFYTSESPVGKNILPEKIKSLKELSAYAKKKKVNLILENTFAVKVKDLKKVFSKVRGVYFCLDTGHANITGGRKLTLDLIDNFGGILKHIHAHDNLGGPAILENDRHLPVGLGKIDFSAIFRELKKVKFSGTITSEVYDPDKKARQHSINSIKQLINENRI